MTVSSSDPDLLHLLRALGMPANCRRFVLTAELGEAVRVEAEFYPTLDPETAPVTKTFNLIEICDHKHWNLEEHGRRCTCGELMWDPGD